MENGVMMQYFEWNMPNDGDLWNQLKRDASHLHAIGITAVWIPPAYKALKQDDEGYGTYDLYDLGEFDQKETIRTKYGTKQQLQEMIDELHKNQVGVYLDAVMNHKAGADYTEKFMAREVNPDQSTEQLGEPYEIEGWTGFNFPGRGNKYSDFKWHWYHFSGIDCDVVTGKKGIFQIVGEGKTWSEGVDDENGNYDFLMFADIDFDHPEVVEEMKKWGIWVSQELHLDGMRLDAIKHINDQFIAHFLEAVRAKQGQQFYAVGEYWKNDNSSLESQVKDWLKPLAYGLILLRKDGYPCIFYGDYYSIKRKQSPHRPILDILLDARKKYAHGEQLDYFDHPNTIGFTRKGDEAYPHSGLALLISNGEDGDKIMQVGTEHQGEIWHEITGNRQEEVTIDEEGNGKFTVSGSKLAVWVVKI